ncbi:GNAT family N-acetyltransferase [Pseudoalteromonas luteoviolacea]|uniref:N-acetyltransferase domain-containing protein n=1 Tax=Pseudoalteromonas luteoviolacea H33 TaxID=1365251 RepID=A0A162ADJ1_9GAMM|nr:GNAT family N-acetyltransferase [Pseudoalteromonas luteoviolacea]KZN48023.1 hypothetical protein N476_22525 [Pseudoalteromonas luteoviolacea H33]KZN73805.1 hypothetical protein N477_22885 [Pseudoalteromonas luteoviolacea H33-S]MBQ4878287.1 GNAT family N-acetyltransferase [Pseudoalteromonas luteoviolacea]MBQ4907442.1 GNAT family N-acetyltransferase [Pseudoalteromonas luteoviolacea]
MTTIETLDTERLRLVAPNEACLDAYLQFYTDGSASKMYGGPIEPAKVLARLKADLGCWALYGFGVWAVQEKETGHYIGTCGFWRGYNWPTELTWWLLPAGRGKGYAFEASKAAIKYAYDVLEFTQVQTYMNDDNTAARALVERLGGVKTDRQCFPDGLHRDIFTIKK